MSHQPIIGPCHLCGVTKVLSFEHVPPRAAFNDRKVLLASVDRIRLNLESLPTHGPMLGDYRTFREMERRDGDTNVIIEMDLRRSGRR